MLMPRPARLLVAAVVLAACTTAVPGQATPPPATPVTAVSTTSATIAVSSPAVTPSAPPHGHVIGGDASFPDLTFRQWAREAAFQGGLALVEIVSVSRIQWSTTTGEAPSDAEFHARQGTEQSYSIGRLVTVRLVRSLRGGWVAVGDGGYFWEAGGQLAGSSQELSPLTPAIDASFVGRRAVAIVTSRLLRLSDLPVDISIGLLWPADEQGRIITPRGVEEGVTLTNVESFLP